mgnify:CR=1 FL=1
MQRLPDLNNLSCFVDAETMAEASKKKMERFFVLRQAGATGMKIKASKSKT